MAALKKQDILHWIMSEASEPDILWFYRSVIDRHRTVIEQVLSDVPPTSDITSGETRRPSKVLVGQEIDHDVAIIEAIANYKGEKATTKLSEVHEREEEDFHLASEELPIVQFSAPMYYCSLDNENFISLDVIRIGNLSSRCEVSFTTQDGSAKAGEKFVSSSGKIVFEPGSNDEEIRIDLLQPKHFDTTTEFKVELLIDPPPSNCQLGRYLYVTRVKAIDGKCFPTNKYSELIKAGETRKIPFWHLFREYTKLTWDNPVVKKGTIKWIIVDMAGSLNLLLRLILNVYLVDKVLAKRPDNASVHLLIIAALMIVPFAGLHFGDFRRVTWKVGGASRGLVQNSLIRKFLNYAQEYRADLKSADLIMAMTRDVTNVVHDGYIKILHLSNNACDLVAILIFQIMAPTVFGGSWKIMGFAAFFLFPMILVSFLIFRRKLTSEHIKDQNSSQDELVATVDRTVLNYRLIADFGQRPFFETRFAKRVGHYNGVRTATNKVLTNNRYFSPWLSLIFVVVYTIIGGLEVCAKDVAEEERLTLGMFLANLRIIKTIGQCWGEIYKVLMDIEAMSPALYRIVELINIPTDVPQRKALNRARRAATATMREEIRRKLDKGWPADHLPILLDSLTYEYIPVPGKHNYAFSMVDQVEFHQGELTALVGPPGEGKSTLLQMVGGVILPEPGKLMVPSHLRVLHISVDDLFFKASLFENLTFGCIDTHQGSDGQLDRVLKICTSLGIPDEFLEFVKKGADGPAHPWSEMMSLSLKCLLGFARAMITNPELLCMHKPTMAFSESTTKMVLKMLKDFCVNKGVEQDPKARHRRRPRTCIFTAAKVASVKQSDRIYLVSREHGIREVPKDIAMGSVQPNASQPQRILTETIESQETMPLLNGDLSNGCKITL